MVRYRDHAVMVMNSHLENLIEIKRTALDLFISLDEMMGGKNPQLKIVTSGEMEKAVIMNCLNALGFALEADQHAISG